MIEGAGSGSPAPEAEADFDPFAERYDEALQAGLSATGEDRHFYAHGRAAWMQRRLTDMHHGMGRVLDFGCGTGSAAPWMLASPGCDEVVGVDPSEQSLAIARREHGSPRARFAHPDSVPPAGQFDTAHCNGVFHHIPPEMRPDAAAYVHRALRPGGVFAFWENNPWNPGTRYVMSQVEFDRDAITLTPPEARSLLRGAGFDVLRTDFLFVFPRALRAFRVLEPWLSSLPMGGQYLILCRKRPG